MFDIDARLVHLIPYDQLDDFRQNLWLHVLENEAGRFYVGQTDDLQPPTSSGGLSSTTTKQRS